VPHNQQAKSWITFKEKDVVEVPLEKGTAAMEKLAPLLTTASVFVVTTVCLKKSQKKTAHSSNREKGD
jgi:hypothetical protein